MSGTHIGGLKAATKIKKIYGKDFFRIQGAIGGHNGTGNKGFGARPETASTAGAKGGRRGRRGYKFIEETDTHLIYRNNTTNELERVEKKDEHTQS